MEEQFIFRTYENEDFDSYCKLFKNVYSHEIDKEFFCWKHGISENTEKKPLIYLIFSQQGELIGANSFFPYTLEEDEKEYKAVQSGDTMVLSSFRGKGLFKKVITFALQDLKAKGYDFVFGFANDNSHPGFNSLGFETVYTLNTFHKIFSYEHMFANHFKSLPGAFIIGKAVDAFSFIINKNPKEEYEIFVSKDFVKEELDFIRECNNKKLHVRKDYELLDKKYIEKPNGNYEVVKLTKGGEIKGIVITRLEQDEMRTVFLMDYFIKENDNMTSVFRNIFKHYRKEKYDSFQTWDTGDKALSDIFDNDKLIKRKVPLYFILKTLSDNVQNKGDAEAWHVTNGDSDTA